MIGVGGTLNWDGRERNADGEGLDAWRERDRPRNWEREEIIG